MLRSSYKLVQKQAKGAPLVGCPRLSIQDIRSIHIGGRSSICNFKTRNAVVKGTQISWSQLHVLSKYM